MRDFVAQSAWRYSVAGVHEVELVGAGGTILCNRAYLEGDALFGRPRRQSHALRSCCVARHRTRPQGVGRPDMAMYIFASAILDGRPIRLFNHGNMRRDFTYVDDVTQAVVRVLEQAPAPDPGWSGDAPDPARSAAPWRIYNIGNNKPVEIARVVELLEAELGRPAVKELVPMQPGDVPETCADVDDLMRDVGFRPATPIEEGIRRFAVWYRAYRQHPHG
jgi:nucleoside-diphosphate-sugar epimerase